MPYQFRKYRLTVYQKMDFLFFESFPSPTQPFRRQLLSIFGCVGSSGGSVATWAEKLRAANETLLRREICPCFNIRQGRQLEDNISASSLKKTHRYSPPHYLTHQPRTVPFVPRPWKITHGPWYVFLAASVPCVGHVFDAMRRV